MVDSTEQDCCRSLGSIFSHCRGLGSLALASFLRDHASLGSELPRRTSPIAPKIPPFRARAKNIIYLFMAGGPSQLELFEYKPKLLALNGQPIPESFVKGKRFAFMDTFSKERPKLMGTRREFSQHGQNGAWVSEMFPHTATIVDDITIVRSCATDVFNHAPAKLFRYGLGPVRTAWGLDHLRDRKRIRICRDSWFSIRPRAARHAVVGAVSFPSTYKACRCASGDRSSTCQSKA